MMRRAVLVLVAACSGGEQVNPVPHTIDLGDNTIAYYWPDGRLEIRRDDVVIVKSNGAFGSRSLDPEAPDRWHDPKKDALALERANVTYDSPAPGVLRVLVPDDGSPTALIRLGLASADDFYTGLGERFDHTSAKGSLVAMHMELDGRNESGTNDGHVPVPWLVSSKGWGMFVETREAGAFDVAKTHPEAVNATFEGRSLTAYFFVARDPLDVVAAFQNHVGLPRPLPRWALGPMIWHNVWTSQTELLAVAAEIRKRHLPTTTLWIDNPWQTAYNPFNFDTARFPDPPAMMKALADLGFRMVAWSTPYLEAKGDAQGLYDAAVLSKYVVHTTDGKPFFAPSFKGMTMIDFTSKAASAFWSDLVYRASSAGFSGFKLDYGEDLVPAFFGARLRIDFADGTTDRNGRAYPPAYHRAYHDALDRTGGGIDIVRASTWGGASQADVIWPGDLCQEFQRQGDPTGFGTGHVGGLPAAIVAAQSLAVSGFPSFGSDTGGFRHGKPSREALLRWAEHTAFSVVMQLGGGGDSHDPWTYDEDTATRYFDLATMHQRLFPYLSTMLTDAETKGTPTLRPLPLAYPNDPQAADFADDEYMLGPDLLVCSITAPGITRRTVHLPPGTWSAFPNGPLAMGAADTAAPLGIPLVFMRAGALIPMMPFEVETLADATDATVVTAASRRGIWEAIAFVQGNARAVYPDGAALTVDDAVDGLRVRFSGMNSEATVMLDLRLHKPVSVATKSGGAMTPDPNVIKFKGDGEVVFK